ncbi:DNA ligase [Lachnellula subtilissima]|uniref:DNA ligase n=1 Tax=Lachnellula subtilissima TaxID=602034 RepID=A0A8H8RDY3_9HELO|nr:DNA ligase [Lachnellula subtilissima]
MPPKQATLGKFFKAPNGDAPKPTPKQSKLSFSSKSNGTPSSSASVANEDVDMKDEDSDTKVKPKVKKEEDVDSKENVKPGTETKKRSRSPPPQKEVKEESKKAKKEAVREEEDDEDDEPVLKRPRRSIKTEEDDDQPIVSSSKSKPKPKPEPSKKSESMPPPPKKIKKEMKEEDGDDVEEPNSSKEPLKRRGSSASASASDIEEGLEEDDEEDEKPEIAAKAREKVQTTLKSKAKDPYPDWKPGEPVPYAALCTTFSLVEMTSKRLVIQAHCSLFLRQVLRLTPDDLLPTVLLMINKLAADYAGIELGIGESLIKKAIGESTGRSLAVVTQDQKEIGDLGLVAVKSRANQPTMFKPKPLTIRGVHKALIDIATTSGNGAQGQKVDRIKKLLSAADGHTTGKIDITKDKGGASEAKFIVRFLEGKLRLGLAERTAIISLAQAMVCHEVEAKGSGNIPSTEQLAKGESILKAVYSELPSYDVIIPTMLEHGLFNLQDNCKLQPGVPLKPMLAKPTKSITEVLDRFENQTFTCEYKYDGERAQIHYVAKDSPLQYKGPQSATDKTSSGGLAAIFSRNSEDLSKKYPDILAKLDTWVKDDTKSFVLDCETVAWDLNEKKVLPFQQLMTRKKKDVKVEDVKVKVCVFAFDLLFLNGEALVGKPLRERRALLHEAFSPVEGEFSFATHMDGQEIDEIQTFLDDSMKASCEGLMVKMLDGSESAYEPSKRSRNWLKIKKDYLAGVGDSLDLVVLGAYYGRGKRTSVFGAFLLACHNPSNDTYETICNIGTGFSEAVLETLHAELSPLIIDRAKPFYDHSSGNQHQPDVWFEPRYVWEVRTADLTLSPRYKAGCKEGLEDGKEKGISLRFPRFMKVREDKKVEEATSSRQVVEMYRKQESVAKNKGPAVDDDFEY